MSRTMAKTQTQASLMCQTDLISGHMMQAFLAGGFLARFFPANAHRAVNKSEFCAARSTKAWDKTELGHQGKPNKVLKQFGGLPRIPFSSICAIHRSYMKCHPCVRSFDSCCILTRPAAIRKPWSCGKHCTRSARHVFVLCSFFFAGRGADRKQIKIQPKKRRLNQNGFRAARG